MCSWVVFFWNQLKDVLLHFWPAVAQQRAHGKNLLCLCFILLLCFMFILVLQFPTAQATPLSVWCQVAFVAPVLLVLVWLLCLIGFGTFSSGLLPASRLIVPSVYDLLPPSGFKTLFPEIDTLIQSSIYTWFHPFWARYHNQDELYRS